MTIKEHIKKGDLPHLSASDYAAIFKAVGLRFTNFDYDLKEEEYDRVRYNSSTNRALIAEKAGKLNKELVDGYNDLIKQERENIANATGKYDSEIPTMNDVITHLETQKNSVNSFPFGTTSQSLNEINQLRVGVLDYLTGLNETKLGKNYKSYVDLYHQHDSSRSDLEKDRLKRRMNRIVRKINRLNKKQGRLINRQNKIVNSSLDRYKVYKERDLRVYGNVVSIDKDYIAKMDGINTELVSLAIDKAEVDRKITAGDATGLSKTTLKVDSRRLQDEINKLQMEKMRVEALRKLQQRFYGIKNKQGSLGPTMNVNQNGPSMTP